MKACIEHHSGGRYLIVFNPEDGNDKLLLQLLSKKEPATFQLRMDFSATALIGSVGERETEG